MKESTTKNSLALITGGSSGIGLAMATELAKRGYNLLLVSNQEEQLNDVKQSIEQKFSIKCFVLCSDLSIPQAAQAVFNYCSNENLQVDILINNAGMLIFSEVVATDNNRVNTILQLHMCTPTLLCRFFGEDMKKRNNGYILNVSSISSVMPYPGISLYGPSKTYMRYFTRAFRHEMKIYGVNVTCLLPGATETGLYDPNKVNLKLARRTGIMQSSDYVAKKAINALLKNKAECKPGIINKLTVWFLPLVPSWVIYLIHKKTNLIKKGNEALD
ncbi:MAG: SDR family NAD(P)-dependent oxidoreductase [Crocinitomicaceae bacterium]|nr:SDR family NAD(P)-dependent oxidoreductase [Crocinitomicaceae bacterium]